MKTGLFYLDSIVSTIFKGCSYVLHNGKYQIIDGIIEQNTFMGKKKEFGSKGREIQYKGEVHSSAKTGTMVKTKRRK